MMERCDRMDQEASRCYYYKIATNLPVDIMLAKRVARELIDCTKEEFSSQQPQCFCSA